MSANPDAVVPEDEKKNYRIRHSGHMTLLVRRGDNFPFGNDGHMEYLNHQYTLPDNDQIEFMLKPSPMEMWWVGEDGDDNAKRPQKNDDQNEDDDTDSDDSDHEDYNNRPDWNLSLRLKVTKKDRARLPVKFALSLVDGYQTKHLRTGKSAIGVPSRISDNS